MALVFDWTFQMDTVSCSQRDVSPNTDTLEYLNLPIQSAYTWYAFFETITTELAEVNASLNLRRILRAIKTF